MNATAHTASTAPRRCERAGRRRAGGGRRDPVRPVRDGGRSPRPGPPAELSCVFNSIRRVACAPPRDRSRLDHRRSDAHDGGRGLLPGLRGRCRDARRLRRGPVRRRARGPGRRLGGVAVALRAALRPRRRAHRRDAVRLGARAPGLRAAPAGDGSVAGAGGRAGGRPAEHGRWRWGWCGSAAPWRCSRPRRAACATTSSARASCARSTTCCRRRARSSTRWRASTPSRGSTARPIDLPAPRAAIARDPEVRAAAGGVVKVQGTACGLGVEGSGWIARDGLVVTNAHVVAGQSDTTVQLGGSGPTRAAHAVVFDPHDDVAILRVDGLGGRALAIAPDPRSGVSGAILGFPQNGPYDVRAGPSGVHAARDHAGRLRRRARCSDRSSPCAAPCARATPAARWSTPAGACWRPCSRPPAAARAAATRCPTRSSSATCGRRRGRHGVDGAPAPPARRYPPASMAKTLVIAEKPSVGQDLARVLPGPVREAHRRRGEDRALAGGPRARHHLGRRPPRPARRARRVRRQVQEVADGRSADRAAHASSSSCATSAREKQMTVVRDQLRRDDIDRVVNACDAGREGELIFTYMLRVARRPRSPSSACGCPR